MKTQKYGVFEIDSLVFVIQSKPYLASELSGLVEKEVNDIDAEIIGETESNGLAKYELDIDGKVAIMWVCEVNRHVYFISLPTVENNIENKQKLREIAKGIGCLYRIGF